VSVEYKSDCGFVCAPYTATLQTDSGSEYTPGVVTSALTGTAVDRTKEAGGPQELDSHGQEGVTSASYSAYDQVKTYFFTIAPTGKATMLTLDLSPDVRTLCHAQYSSTWQPSGTPEHISLPLGGLPMRNNLVVVNQHSAAVRFGQLALAVTAVATTNELGDRQIHEEPYQGHYFVVIALGVKNVSSDPNCTHFGAHLLTNRGYKTEGAPLDWTSEWRTYDLMPGESSGGTISFEVYKGSTPVALALERSIQGERFYAQRLNRPVDMHGGSMVRIPITGVQEVSTSAQQ